MELCPVCFWEDAPGDYKYSHSNQIVLDQAQQNFLKFKACEEIYIDGVRSPQPEEARPSSWRSAEQLRDEAIAQIEEAFRDTVIEDGVTLHQMDVIDDYGSEAEFIKAKANDPEKTWQEISEEKLEKFGMSMIFLDPKGFCFYLPAFMRIALRKWNPDGSRYSLDGVIFALYHGPKDFHAEAFALLNKQQLASVANFLKIIESFDGNYSSEASRGLSNGWGEFLNKQNQS
jgi:hypothetical protein